MVDLLSRQADKFDTVYMAVAFAKSSGVSLLFDHLADYVSSGGIAEITIGVDHQGTSRQGLELLLESGAAVYVFHNPGFQTFHPKIYLFERTGYESIAFAGSSNLTRGGLYENFEFNVRLEHDLTSDEDSRRHQELAEAFRVFTDLDSGLALRLDQSILDTLHRQGYLADEAQSPANAGYQRPPSQTEGGLFRRVPMPSGPRPDSPSRAASITPTQPGIALGTFTMTLGARDSRQQRGYSRDIFIPLAARNASPAFWGWPDSFLPSASAVSGNYLERRVSVLATPANQDTRLIAEVRLYSYAQRNEFRLNCGELVQGAAPGDVLVMSRVSPGEGYDYEAAIIPQSHPLIVSYLSRCVNVVQNSSKRWGYH